MNLFGTIRTRNLSPGVFLFKKAARFLFWTCLIGSTLTCIIVYLKNTRDKESLDNLKSPPRTVTFLIEDTLTELISAGWNCSPISVRYKTNSTMTILQNDNSNSRNRTNETTFLVPNVVHYVWLGNDLNFTFVHYLSFLSVHRFIVPTYIFMYGELGPTGYWWNRTVHDVDNIIHVKCVTKTLAPSGKPFAHKAHGSDVLRTEIILKYGGIYLDTDVIVLKSFDPLRRYRTVMGRETAIGLCNGILIGAKGAPFIRMLLEQYESYTGKNEAWAHRSVAVPNTLSKLFPSLIHVEEKSLNRPNWLELDKIYEKSFNWTDNYAMHLWVRLQAAKNKNKIPQSVEDIGCFNTTIGEIGRHVFYRSKRRSRFLCRPPLLKDSHIERVLTRILETQ